MRIKNGIILAPTQSPKFKHKKSDLDTQNNYITERRCNVKKITLVLCLLSLLGFSSCAHVKKVYYFNDSDKIYSGEANQTVVTPYPYVIMSKGKFREITTVSLTENGKYICTKDGD